MHKDARPESAELPQKRAKAGQPAFVLVNRPSPRGVDDGTRTRDSQNHNLVLYQLNYTHQVPGIARLEELYPTVPAESNRYGFRPAAAGDLRFQAGPSSCTAAVISSVDGPGAGTKAVLR